MNAAIKHTPLHGDGKKPMEHVTRFPHEWALEEYVWDPVSGTGVFTYERTLTEDTCAPGCLERREVGRSQPNGRQHEGWRMWNGRFTFAGQFPQRW